jgi:hypothetical protein
MKSMHAVNPETAWLIVALLLVSSLPFCQKTPIISPLRTFEATVDLDVEHITAVRGVA